MTLRKFAALAVIDARMWDDTRRTAHRATFQYDPRPGFIYVRSRAISSRTNDNFDHFPAEEIEQAYLSFVGKPVFVNHHNDNHRRARGVIIDAALHRDTLADGQADTWVEVLMEVDAVRFPKLAAAILRGDVERTSMGCDVAFSICSVCNNRASTPMEYCRHIPSMKGSKVRRVTASGTQEDVLVYEKCYGLKFFENSLLVEDPADPTAFFLDVDDRGVGGGYTGTLAKAASKTAGKLGDDDFVPGSDISNDPVPGHRISWFAYFGSERMPYKKGMVPSGWGATCSCGWHHDTMEIKARVAEAVWMHKFEVRNGTYDQYSQGAPRPWREASTKIAWTRDRPDDPHALVNLDPANYEWLQEFDYGYADEIEKAMSAIMGEMMAAGGFMPDRDMFAAELAEIEGWKAELANIESHCIPGRPFREMGRCDHCGTIARYFSVFRYQPTGEWLCVGHTCAENRLGLATRDDLNKKRHEWVLKGLETKKLNAEKDRKFNADPRRVKVRDFLLAYTALVDSGQYRRVGFYDDLLNNLKMYHDLTEGQLAAVERGMDKFNDEVEEYALRKRQELQDESNAQPCPTGTETITGKVLSTKYQESQYGGAWKMLVRDDRGFKVWGTIPNSIDVERMDRVTFVATIEPSDDDPLFGFFKRPRRAEVLPRTATKTGAFMARTATRRLAYGETVAPAQVSTLRDNSCPVCGEVNGFNGERCMTCGYFKPPDEFMDPDLTKAKEVDLRQSQEETDEIDATGDSDDVFDLNGPADPQAAPAEGAPKAQGDAPVPTPDDPNSDDDPNVVGEVSAPPSPATTPAEEGAQDAQKGQAPVDLKGHESPPPDGQPHKPVVDQEEPELKGNVFQLEKPEEGVQERSKPDAVVAPKPDAPKADAPKPEGDKPSAESKPADGKPEDAKSEDEDEGDKPEFPPKKKNPKQATTRRNRGESPMRPTLQALAEQQIMLTANRQAIQAIATLAGADVSPIYAAADRRIASLQRRADAENPAQPIPEPGAEAPSQSSSDALGDLNDTDVTTAGGVTEEDGLAGKTVDVTAVGEVMPEETAGTADVTKPTSGIEVSENDSQTSGDVTARGFDPENAFPIEAQAQKRVFASLHLARLRLAAGITQGDDLVVGEEIAKSAMTDDAISAEISTLTRVRTASRAAMQSAPVRTDNRRAVPSLGATASAATPPIGNADPGLDDALMFL